MKRSITVTVCVALVAFVLGVVMSTGTVEAKALNFALSGNPDTLDPHKTSGTLTFQTLKSVYDTLAEPDMHGKIIPALAPNGNRADLYAEIRNHRKLESLMLVGHQPSLGEIAGEIAWGSSENYVEFKKGGVCAIDLESLGGIPQGTIISLLTPSILRKVIA